MKSVVLETERVFKPKAMKDYYLRDPELSIDIRERSLEFSAKFVREEDNDTFDFDYTSKNNYTQNTIVLWTENSIIDLRKVVVPPEAQISSDSRQVRIEISNSIGKRT